MLVKGDPVRRGCFISNWLTLRFPHCHEKYIDGYGSNHHKLINMKYNMSQTVCVIPEWSKIIGKFSEIYGHNKVWTIPKHVFSLYLIKRR